MKRLLALTLLAAAAAGPAEALGPKELVDAANKLMRGNSSHTRITMTVVTPKWTRELDIESWNKGRDRAYILIHSPAKEKGTTTLRRGHEMWTWMARVEKCGEFKRSTSVSAMS